MKKKLLLGIVLAIFVATASWAGLQDRFSKVELEKDPYNRINIPEIVAPSGSPISDYGWIYVKDNGGASNLYFESDDGTVTALIDPLTSVPLVGFSSSTVIYHDSVELTNADIKALRATKKELVAAPGSGYFVEVVSAVLILDYGSDVLSESSDNLVIEYATSGDDITAAIEMTGFIDQSADTIMIVGPSWPLAANAASDMDNNAVQLFNTGTAEFGGNASEDTTMTVKIAYRIHATGL